MRYKHSTLSAALVALTLLILAFPTLAQDQSGSIRGIVYRDVNLNGLCSDEGEVRLGDIPVELANDDSEELIRLNTAADGTYTHSEATLGLWRVTVIPGSGWRVTSQQTREVVLSPDLPDAASVDFCIVEIEESDGGAVTLPESGAPIAPYLLIAAAGGLLLMVLGAALILKSSKKSA